jgi:hypothetical protein
MFIGPFARGGDPFPGRDHRCVADRGDEIPVATRLDTQRAEAGVLAVEGHAFDETSKDLVALITYGDESRWCLSHAPFFSAPVHSAPVQRPYPILQLGRCNVGSSSIRFYSFRTDQRMHPIILTFSVPHGVTE